MIHNIKAKTKENDIMSAAKKIIWAAVFTLFGALLVISTAFFLRTGFLDLMIKEVKSPFTYEETVEKIKNSINGQRGWHVFNVVDQGAEIIKNGGTDVGRITIIQYCHGAFASRMFSADERRKISVFSPKAISIYQKRDGNTYISMMNGEMMKLTATGETKEIILEVSTEVKKIMSVVHGKPAVK
jgi:uncharacterized protein (DUF302 family)